MKTLIAFLLLFLAANGMAHAQTNLQTDLPLPYLAQAPAATKNRPLIIFLHGYGSNEADLFMLRSQLPPDDIYLSVRAPMQLAPGAYQWYQSIRSNGQIDGNTNDVKQSDERIVAFIHAATRKYHTTPSRVILVGFSQGAVMSYQAGLSHPNNVGGIAILSGVILPGLMSRLEAEKKIKAPAMFIGHGDADTRLPFADAERDHQWLENHGLHPEFHAYAGMQHEVSAEEIEQLNHWITGLFSKSRAS